MAGAGSTGGASANCDPTLSQCGADSSASSGSSLGSASSGTGDGTQTLAVGQPVANVLSGSDGWGSSQLLIALVTLLTLGILVVPPLLWLRLGDKR